jgi:glutathione S-transferase
MTELEGPLFRWIAALREASGGSSESEAADGSPERERFAQAAAAVQSALGKREWLLGRFSVADVTCASVLAGAHSRGLLDEWRGLGDYVERGLARPAYVRAAAIWDRPRS